jgi:hypothetical protein
MKTKLTYLLFSFIIIVNQSQSQNSTPNNLMQGIEYNSETGIQQLKGYENLGGGMIKEFGSKEKDYKYGISHYKKGKVDVIVLEEMLSRTKNTVNYRILDTINLKLNKNEEFVYGNMMIKLKEEWHDEILGVFTRKGKNGSYTFEPKRLWQVNFVTKTMEPFTDIKAVKYDMPGCDGGK